MAGLFGAALLGLVIRANNASVTSAVVLLAGLTAVFAYVGVLFWKPMPPRQKLCWRCEYDLRGSPDGAPCPECGAERQRPANRTDVSTSE